MDGPDSGCIGIYDMIFFRDKLLSDNGLFFHLSEGNWFVVGHRRQVLLTSRRRLALEYFRLLGHRSS